MKQIKAIISIFILALYIIAIFGITLCHAKYAYFLEYSDDSRKTFDLIRDYSTKNV